ncbi:MAG: hypothetical protein M0R06_05280 [Sphaerochaeta sp.]|jgi:hypothetical protein|nr:hypothetical protein [Sphaerochaeta sp.]
MATIKLPRSIMREVLYSNHLVISKTIVDQGRWCTLVELLFRHDGKVYRAYYERGSTECQECKPWENEDPVECVEMREVEKTVKVWEEA